jgi:MFS family permease
MTIRAADELGSQMLNVAIGWYVYAQTHNPMSLAYIGLAQFLPNVGLVLLAGHAADRFDRRRVIGVSLGLETLAVALFAAWYAWSVARVRTAGPVYLLLLILGAARAFSSPAMSAMLPRAVSNEEFPRAVAATSSVFQICGIVGPALGGLLYAGSGRVTFAVAAALYLLAMTETRRLPEGRLAPRNQPADPTDKGMLAGIRYIRSNRLLLSLISLDLFAVLLGGRHSAASDLRPRHPPGRSHGPRLASRRSRCGRRRNRVGLGPPHH